MPAKDVKAYVKRNKNDAAEAEAICEAVRRPTMRFVQIKSVEQQGRLMLHRARDLLMRQRTQLINALRAHMAELGIVAAQGREGIKVFPSSFRHHQRPKPSRIRTHKEGLRSGCIVRYCASSVAMVSSGGGDPPCISSGSVATGGVGGAASFRGGLRLAGLARLAVGRRFAAGRCFALVRRFLVVRRFEVARRFTVVRRFAVVRLFTGRRFFRDEREIAARFLRFAIYCLLIRTSTLTKKSSRKEGPRVLEGG